MRCLKKLNRYVGAIGAGVYEDCPRAVLAAIAVSSMTCGGDHLDKGRSRILAEWDALHVAGIVPQSLPEKYRRFIQEES